MKKFVISDIHSFYDEMIKGLNDAGYDKNNPEHFLIVCGDIFDRGEKPLEVYKFLKSIPKENRVFVKGNHEYLLESLVDREFPYQHDMHNGTYETIYDLNGLSRKACVWEHYNLLVEGKDEEAQKYQKKIEKLIYRGKKIKEILKWISDEFVNYYEDDEFIFVHSFIPVKIGLDENAIYFENWREKADPREFYKSTWGNASQLIIETNFREHESKTLVCGHFHTSSFWEDLNDIKYDITKNNPIYYSDKYPELIGLDACTVLTKGINVLVIDGTNIELHNHNGEVKYATRNK